MEFFKSLSQIAKNGKNFDKWENEQKDEIAKREALHARRKYSAEEIAKAKALGERIMDVVDIMDNHSESVAENVETATQPLVASAPLLALYGSGAGIGWFFIRPAFKKIDKIFENNESLKNLQKAVEDYNKTNKGKYIWLDGMDFIFSKSLKRKIKDPALLEQAQACSRELKTKITKQLKTVKLGVGGIIAATLLTFVGINIWTAKLQVDSSKIARFQAREALKDPKNFVEYTPEQIENAKKEIAAHPELKNKKKKEKLKQSFWSSLWNLFKDRKAYKESIKNDRDESKIVTRELTPEEVQNAKKDQEVIQRTIRLINNEAERYSQRMEVAASVIINGTPFLGAAVGGALSWVLNKFGVIEKFVSNRVNKNSSEETKKIYETLKNGKKDRFFVMMKKWANFTRSYIDDFSKNNKNNKNKTFSNLIPKAKRLFTASLAHPKGRGFVISIIGGFITGIAGAFIGLKLQKSSARAGRYTAKRELEKDPKNFIGYTQEDYEQVKDIKNNKKSKSELKDIITFLPTVLKQYFEYEKFNKTELQNKKLLKETLLKQNVTPEQIKDAKNLQRKIFNTFEKVDDKSQSYSEATEAVFDMAQPMVYYGGIAALLTPVIVLGVGVAKGKISPATIIKKVTNFFAKSSDRLKSKWFKRYINNVGENVSNVLSAAESKNKLLAKTLEGIDIRKNSIYEIITGCFKNVHKNFDNFENLTDKEQKEILEQLRKHLKSVTDRVKPEYSKNIDSIFFGYDGLMHIPQKERNNIFNLLFKASSIKTMDKKDYDKAVDTIIEILEDSFRDKDGYTKLYINIQNYLKKYGHIEKMKEDIIISLTDDTKLKIGKNDVNELIEILTSIQENGVNKNSLKSDIAIFVEKCKEYAETIEILKKIYTEQKGKLLENPKVKILIESLLNHPINDSEIVGLFNKFAKTGVPLNISATDLVKGCDSKTEITIKDIIELLKANKDKIKGAKIKDLSILIPQKYKDPKTALEYFKGKVTSMTEEEFASFAERFHIASMDKKTMLEVLDNVKVMFGNLPKEELNTLWTKIMDGFTNNPDEFMKLLSNGKISTIFITPGIQKAVAAAGISWAAFTIALTYIISSWLGEMQLKAGRLGVMEAMKDLKDYRYYANIEPETTVSTQNKTITTQYTTPAQPQNKITSGNLLEGYIQGKIY